mmetsp:Transcript_621/g.2284  ORF Transcript_621/g.2284 Transcript_621/m.2284 type:complete len:96 (+) Transcript_621:227-514(+)
MATRLKPKRKYKLVAVGSSGSGKSSILLRYARDEFENDLLPTVGAAFFSKRVVSPEGESRQFELWDTAGQERCVAWCSASASWAPRHAAIGLSET